MTLKHVTHSIHAELFSLSNEIKRSHCRELIAAYFGFKTIASLNNNGFFHSSPNTLLNTNDFGIDSGLEPEHEADDGFNDKPDTKTIFLERSTKLSPSVEADTVFSCIERNLISASLCFIPYDEFCWEVERLIDSKEAFVPSNNGYWYKQLIEGKKLSENQLSFANKYKESIDRTKEILPLLHKAASKGLPEAFDCLEQLETDDTLLLELLKKAALNGSVYAMSKLSENYEMEEYHITAAMLGDYSSLRSLVETLSMSSSDTDKENAYYFNHIAKLHGHDVTQSTGRAIGDPDYEWFEGNDDYYGPLYFDGEIGISLPSITEELKRLVIQKAEKDFACSTNLKNTERLTLPST